MNFLKLYRIDIFKNIFLQNPKRYCKSLFCVLFYCFFNSSSTFAQTTVTLNTTKSTYLYQGDTKVWGGCQQLGLEVDANYRENSLIEFDFSTIPAGATITAATLRLVKADSPFADGGSSFTVDVKRLTTAWVEGTACDATQTGSARWASAGTVNWTTPGGDFAATTYGSFTGGASDANGTVYTVNILNLVNEWRSGTSNYGLILVPGADPRPGGADYDWFYVGSDENTNTSSRPQLIITYTTLTASATATNASCSTSANGAVNLSVSGGTTPYTFLWSNGATTQNLTNVLPGTYSVTVTANGGITATTSATVSSANTSAAVSGAISPVSTPGGTDGAIDLTISGGASPYTISWSNGRTTQDIFGLTTGNYTVTVTETNGCVTSRAFSVLQGIANKQLYLSDPSQALDRISPVASADATTAQTGVLSTTSTITATITSSKTTFNYQDGPNATKNFGSDDVLCLESDNGFLVRSFIEYDLSSIPAGATITSATLRLVHVNAPDCQGSTEKGEAISVGVRRVTRAWTEGSTCNAGQAGSLTWNSAGPTNWTTPGGDFAATNYATFSGGAADANDFIYNIDVLTLVQEWYNNTNPNYGLALVNLNDTSGDDYFYWYSDDAVDVTKRPQLIVTYTVTGTTSTTFTQSPALCSNLTIKAGQTITVRPYVTITSGSMPTNPSITATLRYGSTNIGTLTNPTYNASAGTLTWTTTLGSDVTIPAGQAIALNVTTAQSGVAFTIDYDSQTDPSLIDLPVSTFINVSSLAMYNAPYPGGSIITSAIPGSTVYLRGTVTDPFGVSDITGMNISLTSPSGTVTNVAGTSVATSGCSRIYEYTWATPTVGGNYAFNVSAAEGLEGTVIDVSALNFPLCNVTGAVTSRTNISCFGANTGSFTVAGSGGTAPYQYRLGAGAFQSSGTFSSLPAGTSVITIQDSNGCTSTTSVTITQPAALTATVVAIQPQCFAFGSISLNVSGGTAPYTYDWSDVAGNINPKDRSGLSGGSYSVIVRDANGCTTTANVTLTSPTGCSPINICRSNTIYTFSVAPDPNNTSYTWTVPSGAVIVSGQGTYQIVVNMTGVTPNTYQVCVTANNSCGTTAQTCQDINVISPVASATANPVCSGGNLQLFASGGVNYSWAGPSGFVSVSANPTILNATTTNSGVYTVTVTDANSCNATATVNVSVSPAPSVATTVTNSTCGGNSGAINSTVSGGTAPYSFLWNNGLTTQNISGLAPGVYTLSVTDANGCVSVRSGTVNATNGPSITVSSTNIACSGASTGSITTTVTGGTSPYTYNWSNGVNTANQTNLSAGTYILTVTDAAGCVNQNSVTITQPSAIQTNFTETDVNCFGQSTGSITILASGGTGAYTYSWTKNGTALPNTTSNLTSIGAGVYVATVRDANNCTATQSVTITQPNAALSATSTITNVKCNGGNNGQITLTVTGGVAPYSYSWTGTGGFTANTKDISGRSAGTYNVTITDANNCTFVLNNQTITAPPALVIGTPTVNNVSCFGGNNGSITLSISGGTSPYTFLWSNGATTNNLTGLAAGSYTLTVTDANNCKITSSAIVVTQPTSALVATATATNPNCAGSSTGSIVLTVSGGTSPYTFVWSNGSTVQSPSGLIANAYSVTVTDLRGCITQSNATLTNPAVISVSGTITNILCNGGNTGAITLTASGGVGTLTFAWSDGPTTQNRTGLTAGTYNVTVTDANGCNTARSFTITQNSPIVGTLNNTNISCFGSSNGSINLTVSGGTSPYTFLWSNGQTTEDISGLGAGTFTVTIRDANNCTITRTSSAITQPTQLIANAGTVNNVTCKGGSNGSANVIASGGTAPYTYSWSSGSLSQTATGLSNGTYVVTVNDAAGCTTQSTVSIGEPGFVLNLYAAVRDAAACGGNNGSIETTIENGVSPYIFAWTGPTTIGNIQNPTNLATGSYSLTATDAIGCTATVSMTIGRAPTLTANIIVENATCTGTIGTATASAAGGNQPYSFMWTPGSVTTSILSVSSAGNYSVTVTDARGCTVTESTNVTFSPSPSATLTNQVICDGQSVTLTPTNILNTSSYLWSINDVPTTITTPSMTVTPTESMSYSLRLTSSAGCVTNIRTFVTVNILPPKPTFANGVACQGETISLTATSNSGMTVVWSFGGSTMTTAPILNTSNPGLVAYYVSQFDNTTGCVSELSIQTLTVNPKPIAEVNVIQATCLGLIPRANASIILSKYTDNDQFAWGTSLPTNPTYTFANTLLNGRIVNNLSNTNATYVVRIKNQYDCSIDRTAQIIASPCPCPLVYCEPATMTKIK